LKFQGGYFLAVMALAAFFFMGLLQHMILHTSSSDRTILTCHGPGYLGLRAAK
jgi:hypothetical protein